MEDLKNRTDEHFQLDEEEFPFSDYQQKLKSKSTLVSMNPRLGFVRKVFGILSVQLLITIIACVLAMSSQSYVYFLLTNSFGSFLIIFNTILHMICIIALLCFPSLGRTVPYNYVVLFIFTFTEAFLLSFICMATDPTIVIMAFVLTLSIVLTLTLYAFTTKTDFTLKGGLIFLLGSTFLMISLAMIFIRSNFLEILIAGFGVFVYGIYLIYDLQLIMGGKDREIGLDEYIYGALLLYIDIISIFLEILKILSKLKEK